MAPQHPNGPDGWSPDLALLNANQTARRAAATRRTLRLLRSATGRDKPIDPDTLASWTRADLLIRHNADSLRANGLWVTASDARAVLDAEARTAPPRSTGE